MRYYCVHEVVYIFVISFVFFILHTMTMFGLCKILVATAVVSLPFLLWHHHAGLPVVHSVVTKDFSV